ncbi:isochorismate synthase [Virgibacillus phasianinus]|uniref:Isochorismate synthase MenF n=1 Tax=Virgibacillus phasianinus TaxID=2017483 RepID=A0A220U465_9BACI|nr:isochorismate synthase [Virgibacillus phasianinus]ASK62890.1 isochorismate synthase [Virgibacillus phasianinus]
MIETKEEIIESTLNHAKNKTLSTNHIQLVSITEKIDTVNPLHFFEAAKQLQVNRTFWCSTAEDFLMVGVGNTYEIEATDNRFQETDEQWNRIKQEAIIHDPFQQPGTGLVVMGGMSFDPKKERTSLWENFSESAFIVPAYTLTKYKETYYFTINVQISSHDQVSMLAKEINESRHVLLKQSEKMPIKTKIADKYEIAPEKWKETVVEATNQIKTSNLEKIVLSREVQIKLNKKAEITAVLDDLLATQTNSFVFAFEHGEDCFVGATPERLIKIQNEKLLSTCLAGTAPRGQTPEEDEAFANQLYNDEKNRSEHDFVVKMIKQAIRPYSANIEVPNEPIIYPLKNLQHLYTPVTATVRQDVSIFDIIGKLHPTPALGGVPRQASLQFIREHELLDRGWYGAPVGWIDHNNNSEFAVAIRSGLIKGDTASLFAGCGVVKDSDPEAEYEETNIKLVPMLSVLGG